MAVRELELQGRTVKAVGLLGGYALKVSHRQFVGLPDLLVKIPGHPTAMLECKWRIAPKKADTFALDVTPAQFRTLWRMHEAGIPTGVLSFLTIGKEYGMRLIPTPHLGTFLPLPARVSNHVVVAPRDFNGAVAKLLESFHLNYPGVPK